MFAVSLMSHVTHALFKVRLCLDRVEVECIMNGFSETTCLFFSRAELSKLQIPCSTRARQQVTGRPGQEFCLDSQHDRRSPTGRAETTLDNSKPYCSLFLTA